MQPLFLLLQSCESKKVAVLLKEADPVFTVLSLCYCSL